MRRHTLPSRVFRRPFVEQLEDRRPISESLGILAGLALVGTAAAVSAMTDERVAVTPLPPGSTSRDIPGPSDLGLARTTQLSLVSALSPSPAADSAPHASLDDAFVSLQPPPPNTPG